jgi:hypothetical protein
LVFAYYGWCGEGRLEENGEGRKSERIGEQGGMRKMKRKRMELRGGVERK